MSLVRIPRLLGIDPALSYLRARRDGWVQARIEELPAVITAAPSREQARAQVIDALREYLLALRDLPAAPATGVEREAVDLLISV